MSGIAVIGAGAFGTSLALTLAQDGSDVALWGRDADDIAEMARAGPELQVKIIFLVKPQC